MASNIVAIFVFNAEAHLVASVDFENCALSSEIFVLQFGNVKDCFSTSIFIAMSCATLLVEQTCV